MLVVVPVYIWDEIDRKLDAAFVEHPDAEKDRDVLRSQLIAYVDEHGRIPDFQLMCNEAPTP